jgi:hypothetical protein
VTRKKCLQMKQSSLNLFTVEMLVWLANMSPDTRCDVVTYGDLRERATWIEAGPQGMN